MPKKRYKKTEPKTVPVETKEEKSKDRKEYDGPSKTPAKVDKSAIVATPIIRSGLPKASQYSPNWKSLSKQLGLPSSKKKEEIKSDVHRESKQGPQTNTSFKNRGQRKERVGQLTADPMRAKTQTRDSLLNSKSRSTRDKRTSLGARKMSINALGSQAVMTSSQTTVTSSRSSTENKCARTGTKRRREGDGSELWFDDVEMEVVGGEPVPKRQRVSLTSGSDGSAGKYVSLDCEMVGTGPEGDFSMLARCSIVNHHGNLLYNSYVAPMDVVTDYRTEYSGIRPEHLRGAPNFRIVQKVVSDLIKGRTLVGHGLHNDLKALLLSHPKKDIRDTSKYKPFRRLAKSKTPSLKKLAAEMLGMDIHQSQHDSIEDAQVAMKLYRLHKSEWEAALKAREAVRERKKREGVRGGDSRPGRSRRSGRRKNSTKEADEVSKPHLFNSGSSDGFSKAPKSFNVMLHLNDL